MATKRQEPMATGAVIFMSETWSADVVGVKQSKMCESTKLINLPKAEVA